MKYNDLLSSLSREKFLHGLRFASFITYDTNDASFITYDTNDIIYTK